MEIAQHFVVHETEHWIVNHHLANTLPGYLMLGTRVDATSLADLSVDALAELGGLMAKTQQIIECRLKPKRLYIGRYGHQPGLPFHFHFIPVYHWVEDLFWQDPRYRLLETLAYSEGAVPSTDGAELTLFVWREFGENPVPPKTQGPSIEEVIKDLRIAFG